MEEIDIIRVAQLPIIEERLHEIKEAVEQRVNAANLLVCTEETYKTIKAIRADLKKQFDELEDQRKAVKAAIMEPYDRFNWVYKECVADVFNAGDQALRAKIDQVERDIKGRCEAGLREYFAELAAAERVEWLKYERAGIVIDMASATQKTPRKLREKVSAFVVGVAEAVNAIAAMDDAEEIMVEYKRSLNFPAAVQAVKERQERVEAEREAREARAAAKEREAEAVAKVDALAPPVVLEAPVAAPVETEKVFAKFTFTVYDVTRTQLIAVREFLKKEGVRYA